ncbi:hypothetical protein I317_04736 [Kwoniella heveanensis CBS 569]|nr:hypothetical protein I317_04736 [Kwoniella heveanensis CBS 569]
MFPSLVFVPLILSLTALIGATPTPNPASGASGAADTSDSKREVHVLAGAPINSLVLNVEPDSPAQCSNASLSWSQGDAGSAPYRIQIGTGGYYANLTWLYEYTNLTSTNFTWTVPGPNANSDLTAGDTLIFQLWDSTNTITYSQNHLVRPANLTANGTCPDFSSSDANDTTPINAGSAEQTPDESGNEAASITGGGESDGQSGDEVRVVASLIAEFEKTLTAAGESGNP